jgi:hypothetical protein
MNRPLSAVVCAGLSVGLLILGLAVPAHLRAVDGGVLARAGRNTQGLVPAGVNLANSGSLGAAQFMLQAAEAESIPNRDLLGGAVARLTATVPGWQSWGGGDPRLEQLFASPSSGATAPSQPVTDFVLRLDNRGRVMDLLTGSSVGAVHELLRCRDLTNTVIFPPSRSASGQAFDAAVSVTGLLLNEGVLTPGLGSAVHALARSANQGGDTQPIEELLMDMMSLGQRMNWNQLSAFVGQIDDPRTLHLLSDSARRSGNRLPVLFAAVQLSGEPAAVADYLGKFSQTALADLGSALGAGAGGVQELLHGGKRLYAPARILAAANAPLAMAQYYSLAAPRAALAVKWALYLCAGFFLAMTLHFARPAVSSLERPLQVRGFHLFREILFAPGFLLVVLLLSEPFLAQENQKADFTLRLRLPTAGGTALAGKPGDGSKFMNEQVMLTMLLFFVLQALLYIMCLVKLAEIRRQRVPARTRLKLLENEDHLFDAGLYLGFLGTIVSFILVSLGVFKQPSLMAAYSSTSFGIIFVSAFKILHLRPSRRRLLMESEKELDRETADRAQAPARSAMAATV